MLEFEVTLKSFAHYGLHFIVPGLIAFVFYRDNWKKSWFILMATMLVDLDHLVASPIFDSSRCSIGFHPLHSYVAMGVYVLVLFLPKYRIFGVGLLFHMATDWSDCLIPL
ncbi:MAG: DUF6122 family protein [Fibrobacterales bacterium]